MTRRMDRRRALGALGTVSLGALLAGCGDDRATSPDTASRFGDESNSTLTPEMVSDRVFAAAPYDSRGERSVRNDGDGIFDETLVLDLSREGDGYLGTISFDVAAG